jgi:hypothetical protein
MKNNYKDLANHNFEDYENKDVASLMYQFIENIC